MKELIKQHKLGFFQVDPLPSQSELSDYYSQKYYQESKSSTYQSAYSKNEIDFIKLKIAQKASNINKIIKEDKGTFLDVGCGEGFAMNYFHEKKWNVHGIDFSEYGILKFHPNLLKYFQKGEIYSLLEERVNNKEKFDVVWVGNVLEHVLDPIDLLIKLKALLQPDGVLVITVPNDFSSFQEALEQKKLVDRKYWIAYPDHISYFNYNSLRNVADYTGYHCEEIISDFPIELFLLHPGSNYIQSPELGKEAHLARIAFENHLSSKPIGLVNSFYKSLSKLDLGRDLTIFLKIKNS
jgi:2-polyprenyl-3-methyl-5-hydroxy-6-metoxy-1,4-benzoquinol methylase